MITVILIALGPPTFALIFWCYMTTSDNDNRIENMPGPLAFPVVGNLLNIGLTPQGKYLIIILLFITLSLSYTKKFVTNLQEIWKYFQIIYWKRNKNFCTRSKAYT